ncbi:IS3 family transposase [Acidipropionibacterium acidipropionici]|nr:IS3 family transposase [Acidipropionibacterium acidipropionici]
MSAPADGSVVHVEVFRAECVGALILGRPRPLSGHRRAGPPRDVRNTLIWEEPDITYIPTLEGFSYLATVLDCCTKKAVGYAVADHMRTELICEALDMAVRNCPPVRGATIFHSDRGSQYMSREFSDLLESYGVLASVGRTGVCWDNAWAESFNATLKNERVHRVIYRTHDEAIRDAVSWIELRYNQKRLHSSLGYRTPNEVEAEYRESRMAA